MGTKPKPHYPDGKRSTLFEEGLEFQDFVADLLLSELGIALTSYSSQKFQLRGENRQGMEIKLDRRMSDTGRISFEVAEKSNSKIRDWTPSGIMRDDNSWLYIQGNYKKLFVFGKEILKLVYEKQYLKKTWEPTPTIKTFLMPIDEAERIALKVFNLI